MLSPVRTPMPIIIKKNRAAIPPLSIRRNTGSNSTDTARLTSDPPRLYRTTGIFPSTISGGIIRHWPPVPVILNFLCTSLPFSSFISM